MKIFFLTPYLPSNRAGGENFTRLLLEQLSISCQIDLVYYKYYLDPYYVAPNDNVRILKVCPNSTIIKLKNCGGYPFIHPLFSVRFDRKLLEFLRQIVSEEHYDWLYLDHSQMFLYGKYFPEMNKILMSHDVMAQRFSRTGTTLNRKWVIASEKKVLSLPNSVIFTFSSKDAAIVEAVYHRNSFVTNFFLDRDVINAVPHRLKKQIIFFGKWTRSDNTVGLQWFFEEVGAYMDKSIKIIIIGTGLPVEMVKRLKEYKNVEYRGFVENPYQMIADSLLVVSPLFSGAGVKVKVVESLACGTPVLGTSIAFEGIDKKFKKFMLEAEVPEDYICCINSLNISLDDRKQFKESFLKNYNEHSIVNFVTEKI